LHLTDAAESRLSLVFNPLHHFGKRGARIEVMDGCPRRGFGGLALLVNKETAGKESVRYGASVALLLNSGQ
jgi:hypothetical protein